MENEAWRDELAANLARLRREKGFTQAELGEKLNYSDKSVSKWERAESAPDIAVLMRLCDMYNVSLDELTGRRTSTEAQGQASVEKPSGMGRALTLLIAESAIWLTAVIVFSALTFINAVVGRIWLVFIYALPLGITVPAIFLTKWKLYPWAALAFSVAMWSVCVCLQLSVNIEMAGMIYVIACAVQLIALITLGAVVLKRKYRK